MPAPCFSLFVCPLIFDQTKIATIVPNNLENSENVDTKITPNKKYFVLNITFSVGKRV